MSLPARLTKHKIVRPFEAPDRGGVLAVWSEQTRAGDWSMPRHFRVACVMGSAVVDLREARIPEGTSVIEIFTLFGSVEVLVPPGVRVESAGDALGGAFSVEPSSPEEGVAMNAPVLRLVGSAYFASVTAEVRYAGETGKEARRRNKLAARR